MTRRPWPLARGIALGVTALTAVVLLLAGTALTVALRGFLLDRLDQQARALLVATGELLRDSDQDRFALPAGSLAVAFGADGGVRRTVTGSNPPDDAAGLAARLGDVTGTGEVSWSGTSYRVASTGTDRDDVRDGVARIAVALPQRPVEETVERLVAAEATIGLLAAGAVGLGSWVVVRRRLRPLQRMSENARRIAASDLSSPDAPGAAAQWSPAAGSAEVVDLDASVRTMLGHVDASLTARAEAEQRLRRFLAAASHELRTPLASIRGYAELSRRGMVDGADAATVSGRIESEAARMGLLVDDLLLLARLDEDRPLLVEDVDLALLARECAADAAVTSGDVRVVVSSVDGDGDGDGEGEGEAEGDGVAAEAGAAVPPSGRDGVPEPSQTPPPEPCVVVRGDHDRLRQVLVNLLANAVAHAPAASEVEVSVRRDGDEVEVTVTDRGPGVPTDARADVFEPFYRLDQGRSRAVGGTGLGLSIVRSLVQAHGGRVWLDDAPGGGTVAHVRLPVHGPT